MKLSVIVSLAMICASMSLLSACASGTGGSTPSLSAQTPQTGRVPSAGNIRATQLNAASRMTAPVSQ